MISAYRYLSPNGKYLFLLSYYQLSFKSHQRGMDNLSVDRDSWLFYKMILRIKHWLNVTELYFSKKSHPPQKKNVNII